MDEPPLSPDFLEQRLKLWLRLAESLDQARAALLQGDVVLFEQSTQARKQLLRSTGWPWPVAQA
jgi:hypothetical protein